MSQPEISVVIRTFNEEKYLPALLDALHQQSRRDFETIVVDSGSFDRTRQIAAAKADKLLGIENHDFTFGHSLNVGIQNSEGIYLAIVSAHALPVDENWLDKLIDPLHDKQTAMVYGRQKGGDTSKFSEIQDMRHTFGLERKVLRPPLFFANNANSAIRRDLWQDHPFDESLLGLEDIEWAKYWMERGYQVVYEPDAVLYHIHDENWRQVRRRYYREAVAASTIGIRTGWHALSHPVEEIFRAMNDIGCILLHPDRKPPSDKNIVQLARETALFRLHKTIGTVKGLLNGAIMENPKAREEIFFDRTCQAVVIQGPGRASLEEIRIPEIKPGDVLIRVAYEAVCATDLEIFEGSLGYYKNGAAEYPIIPGHEFSGHVVTTGSNVNHLQAGDAVVAECIQSCGNCDACRRENRIACKQRIELGVIGRNGGYAKYVVVPGRFVHRLPPNFDLLKACLCEPLAVVLKGLERLRRIWLAKKAPERCAVVGAGPVGHLCARVLAFGGHQVTVFDHNSDRLEHFAGSDIETSNELSRVNEFEHLVEATGDPDALDTMLHQSPAGATILLLGLPYGHRQFSFESVVAFDKIVIGSVGSETKDFVKAIELLPQIETAAFNKKILPLNKFRRAWKLAQDHKYLKIMLEINKG